MSDEERDAGVDDQEATGSSTSAELELGIDDDLSGVSDPALAGRLETIHRSMSTLGMRIDALVTSTTSYRSALTDRLNEYADLVTKLTRTQASDLEEYRRANERTLSELRRGLTTSEETLERVGARIDSMLTDAESTDDSSRRVLAEVRSILEAQESLGRFLTESLDQFGEQVVGRLATSEQAAAQQLVALQAAVTDVDNTPDPALSLVDDRLAGIEDRLAVVASNDAAVAMGNRFDTLHAALEELDRSLRADLEGVVDTAGIAERIERIERELGSSATVATESFGEIAGLRSKVDAILETSANESGAVAGTLEHLKETLQDLASGEVVGALWDEVRQVRATVEALVDRDADDGESEAAELFRADVASLTSSVRDLLEQAEVVDEQGMGESDGGYLTAVAADVAALRSELAEGLIVEPSDAFGSSVEQLRTDLVGIGERLSVVAELRDSVAELRTVTEAAGQSEPAAPPTVALPDEVLEELRSSAEAARALTASVSSTDAEPAVAELPEELVAELRDSVAELRTVTEAAGEAEPSALELPAELEVELRTLRTGVEDIIARLDEGLVLADDDAAAAQETSPELADQVATLRDQVSAEFERVRHLVESGGESVDLTPLTARLDRLHDDIADRESIDESAPADLSPVIDALHEVQEGVARLLDRPEAPAEAVSAPAGDTYATVDPDVIDLLREEIRAAGSVSDELVETLSGELKALRRRIRLRAEGEIFSDAQLEIIAAAVASKLAD